MRRLIVASLAATCLLPLAAHAQQPGYQQPGIPQSGAMAQGGAQQSEPADGADQVVGLFLQTCLHYAGNAPGLRSWLAQERAPQMAQQMQSFFLAGRQGTVYDVSSQTVRLALVSADDNSCSAYADTADAGQTIAYLQQAMQQAGIRFTGQAAPPDQRNPSLSHAGYQAMISNRPWAVLVTTSPTPVQNEPQAVLTLRPAS